MRVLVFGILVVGFFFFPFFFFSFFFLLQVTLFAVWTGVEVRALGL